jgi:CubicO group peptidase (beta-lactamase class C family)
MHIHRALLSSTIIVLIAALLAAPAPGRSQTTTGSATAASSSPATSRGVRDRAELEAFIDGIMAGQLRRQHVAGAVVAVVKDGALLLAKGYGYADVERRKPVDPATTLFRIGSVSKLFTWTAVMQLVEEGKLDLDADVNRYLDFKIPATYPQPITLRHLLTHTPGFEEDSRGIIGDDPKDLLPLGRWLASHIPARVRPPGVYSAYSNYGATLAGYIVERVSGMPWEEYVERRILAPLGMTHTTARQPLPSRLAPDMSRGYAYQGGRFVPKPFEIVLGGPPAGSISASATDIARFMLAHLGGGALDGQRILSEATTATMHARAFGHDPRLPGWALGFYEQWSHGLRLIGHGGDTQWFHSDLMLVPAEHLGIFVSYNTDKGAALSFRDFVEAFLDHYYPDPPPVAVFPADARAQAARVAGAYESNRRSYTTFQKAAGLATATTIRARPDGSLIMNLGNGDAQLVPVGPLLYREALGSELVAFQADGSGRIVHAFVGSEPMIAYDRVPWYAAPRLHLFILGVSTIVFVGVLVAAVRRRVRRWLGAPWPVDAPFPGRGVEVGLALAYTAFVAVLVVLAGNLQKVLLGTGHELAFALALPVIGAVLTAIAIWMAIRQWRTGAGTRGMRVRYDLVVLVALLFLWSLNHWNLLGWRM